MIADQTITPSLVDNFDGSGILTTVSLDLSAYTGQVVTKRFFFDTMDGLANAGFQGIFVDNIVFQ